MSHIFAATAWTCVVRFSNRKVKQACFQPLTKMQKAERIRIRADFNGLFGELLCISHGESCLDQNGRMVLLCEGMKLTAYDEDLDDGGRRDDLIASGTVERAPDWLTCTGSRWVLKIDENGVRHESELPRKSEPA